METPPPPTETPPKTAPAKISLRGILHAFGALLICCLTPVFAFWVVTTAVRIVREDSRRNAKAKCVQRLGKIEGAKEQFALEHNFKPGHPVALDDIWRRDGTGYLKEFPKEPLGGTYLINPVGVDAVCVDHAETHNLEFDPATWVQPPCE